MQIKTFLKHFLQLFSVVGNMLSYANHNTKHFWKKCKFRNKEETCFVSMWLVRQDDGEPTYFQMIMVPLSECSGAVGAPKSISNIALSGANVQQPDIVSHMFPPATAAAGLVQMTAQIPAVNGVMASSNVMASPMLPAQQQWILQHSYRADANKVVEEKRGILNSTEGYQFTNFAETAVMNAGSIENTKKI